MPARSGRLTLLALAALLSPEAAPAQIAVAVIGDSLSAEYQAPQSSAQRGLEGFNWVEILSRVRPAEIGFGAYDGTLDGIGAPLGYAHDHAVGGAMILNSNLPQQLAGAVADVNAGAVDAVVFWMGRNDYFARNLVGGSFDPADPGFQAFQTSLVDAVTGALDALIAAGATDIVLGRIQGPDPNRADIVAAVQDANARIAAAVALRPEVTFFDALADIVGRIDRAANVLRMDGLTLTFDPAPESTLVAPPGGVTPTQCGFSNLTQQPACPTAAYQTHFVGDDGAHPTTPAQGLLANTMIGALNARGFALTPLSDAEILAIAGVTPQTAPPLSLAWTRLASKCKGATSVCRLKGKLLARNPDAAASAPATLRFLLSADATADAGDRTIASRTLRALGPGKAKKVPLKATLPAGVVPSGAYLIVVATRGSDEQTVAHGPLP